MTVSRKSPMSLTGVHVPHQRQARVSVRRVTGSWSDRATGPWLILQKDYPTFSLSSRGVQIVVGGVDVLSPQ